MIQGIVFYSLAAVTIIAGVCVVLLRNVLHSALMLGLCLLGVAGIYGSLGADFLFASQILIYVGGIAVLILFVVLLAGRASELIARQTNNQWLAGLVVCSVIGWGLYQYTTPYQTTLGPSKMMATTHDLGKILLGDFAVPFELISVILLTALTGAVIFSKPESE